MLSSKIGQVMIVLLVVFGTWGWVSGLDVRASSEVVREEESRLFMIDQRSVPIALGEDSRGPLVEPQSSNAVIEFVVGDGVSVGDVIHQGVVVDGACDIGNGGIAVTVPVNPQLPGIRVSIRLNDQCKLVVAGLKVWHANADNGVPASTIDYGGLLSDDGRESAETGVSGASGSSGATRYKASGESEWTSVGGYRAFTRLRFDYEEGHDGLRLIGMFSRNCPHTFPYSWMGVNGPCREYPETVSRSLIKGVAGTQFWVDEVANTDGNFIWIQKTTMTISRGSRPSITCTSSKNWVAEGWDGLDCEGRVRER